MRAGGNSSRAPMTKKGELIVPSETPAEPPYVPMTTGGWPKHRTPRWVYGSFAALVVVGIAVGITVKPTTSQRAYDMKGFLGDMTTDIESCAGGVSESLSALHQIQAGTATTAADVSDAIVIAQNGAQNCGPATNEEIDDLQNYQVTESLASFKLAGVVTDLVNWADPDAVNVQAEVATLLQARGAQARSKAQAQLTIDLAALNQQRASINSVVDGAMKSLGMHQAGLKLPS
jgi:hypothetical protein